MMADVARVVFEDSGDEVEVPDGEGLQESCEEQGVPFACTEGCCGTCVIEVPEGMENLTPYTVEEEDFLGETDCERLACQCQIKSGTVRVRY